MKNAFSREEGAFRDDRLFYVGCDDHYAPDQYFSFFRIPRIKVKVFPALDDKSHAQYVVDRMKEVECEEGDEVWVLLDTDHCIKDGHFHSYELAISEARSRGMNVAISNPCFEVWLACHHWGLDELVKEGLKTAKDFNGKLEQSLGYDKCNLRETDFTVETLPDAYRRAKTRDGMVSDGDKPDGVTTRIYRLWHNILQKAAFSQLSDSLRALAREIREGVVD